MGLNRHSSNIQMPDALSAYVSRMRWRKPFGYRPVPSAKRKQNRCACSPNSRRPANRTKTIFPKNPWRWCGSHLWGRREKCVPAVAKNRFFSEKQTLKRESTLVFPKTSTTDRCRQRPYGSTVGRVDMLLIFSDHCFPRHRTGLRRRCKTQALLSVMKISRFACLRPDRELCQGVPVPCVWRGI